MKSSATSAIIVYDGNENVWNILYICMQVDMKPNKKFLNKCIYDKISIVY